MKKLLLALMVSAGITSAYAQSSVSIYGILDTGYINTTYKGTGTNPNNTQHTSAFGTSAESTSRLGFKGTEDLGGGRSAFFTFETGMTPTNATVSTWDNRQSFVGLKQNGLGQASIGTQYTPIHTQVCATDAGQCNNMPGSLIFASTPQSNGNPGLNTFAAASSAAGNTGAYTVRTSNTLNVASDDYKGFKASGFYVQNGTDQTATTTTTNGLVSYTGPNNYTGWGLNGNYTWNKLYVTATYQALKSQVPGTLTNPVPSPWTSTAGGVNTQDNQKYVSATYDFGVVKAFAQYVNRKAIDTLNSNYTASRTAQQIGVRGNITPTVDAWASIGNGKVQAFGASQPTANFAGYQVGSNYYLSKRTNLYAIYGQNKTTSTSTFPAVSSLGYAVGVRHTF